MGQGFSSGMGEPSLGAADTTANTHTIQAYHASKVKEEQQQERLRQQEVTSSSSSSHNTSFTLAACTVLAVYLAAKTLRSSKQARQAGHDARAWRRVSMALLDRGKGGGRFEQSLDAEWTEGRSRRPPGGLRNLDAMSDSAKSTAQQPRVAAEREEQARFDAIAKDGIRGECSPSEVKAQPQPKPCQSPSSKTSSTSSLYSEVHPHEDWNWTPSDYPRSPDRWKRNRLHPWTIKSTSMPQKPSTNFPPPTTRKAWPSILTACRMTPPSVAPAPPTNPPVATKEVGRDSEPASWEEEMLRYIIWPDSEPCGMAETTCIAEAILADGHLKQKNGPIISPLRKAILKRKSIAKPRSILDIANAARAARQKQSDADRANAERVQALERQVWALLSRAEKLEQQRVQAK